jgi:hypothetical protein
MPSKYKTKAQRGLKKSLETSVSTARHSMLGTTRVKPTEMREALSVYFEKAKYDPVKEMIEAAQNPDVPIKERIGIHKEFIRYMAPSLKSIDIQQHVDANIKVIVRRFGEDVLDLKEVINA